MGATAGSNAAPIVANIIRRSAAMLGVKPEFGHEKEATVASYE
jgi:cell division protein FtsI (penicillin-binding protein 3)